MRPALSNVISDDELNGLQVDEEVTVKQIIQWIVDALNLTVDCPDFTVNSAGKVSASLFEHLKRIARDNSCFEGIGRIERMDQIVEKVERVFDATITKGSSLKCWIQIGQFLNDLPQHCAQPVCNTICAKFSASLLRKMIAVPNFDTNKDIVDSMLLYWKCGSAFVVAGKEHAMVRICSDRVLCTMIPPCIKEFFDLIGKNTYFSSDAFYPHTAQMLLEGIRRYYNRTLPKYLDAILFVLESTDQEAKRNMATYLNDQPVINYLIGDLNRLNRMKSAPIRKMIIRVAKTMLKYSRDANVPFDMDWPQFFADYLFTNDGVFGLILYEVQGTGRDKLSKSRNLIERIAEIHIERTFRVDDLKCGQQLESTRIRNLMNRFKSHVDFVTCEDLFYVLRKHVSDDPAMCTVIILLIDFAAKTIAEQPQHRDAYTSVITKVYHHIDVVKHHPELLCRLIKIVDIPAAYNVLDENLKSNVQDAFFRCGFYATAIQLLQTLKGIGLNDNELLVLFERVLTEEITGNRTKEMLILLLALQDTFEVFKVLNPSERRAVFDYFKKRFESAVDDAKALYIALLMQMLAFFHWLPEVWETTVNDANFVIEHLNTMIKAAEDLTLAAIYLGIAVCVYYTYFDSTPAGANLRTAFLFLSTQSHEFRLRYSLDVTKNPARNDLQLLTKFWRCAIAVYDKGPPTTVLPRLLFEGYDRVEINLIHLANEFISTVLHHGSGTTEFQLLAKTITQLVRSVKKNPVSKVRKLFATLATMVPSSELTYIAFLLFDHIVDVLRHGFPRTKTLWQVQKYLYNNRMVPFHRNMAMDILNKNIDHAPPGSHQDLKEFRTFILAIAGDTEPDEPEMDVDEQPEVETNGSEMDVNEQPEMETNGSESRKRRRTDQSVRDSLPAINQSIAI